jgi:hypothetical protein
MERPYRQKLAQDFFAFPLTVGVTPTPIGQAVQQATVDSLYTTILFSLRVSAANTVFIGGQNINAALFNGLEIVQGNPIALNIRQDRQLYELQAPMVDQLCTAPDGIPFIAWDISRLFAVAVAPTVMGVILFKEPFI